MRQSTHLLFVLWSRMSSYRYATRAALLASALAVVFFCGSHLRLNLHEVVPGIVRSAQPSADELEDIIARHGIVTIINLRGPWPGHPWYDAERDISRRHSIAHIDFRLSAMHDLEPAQADELVALMRQLPKPMLLHCEAGADRSGLAAALYRFAIAGESARVAGSELSVWYGHIPRIRPAVAAMDRSFAAYVDAH